MAEIVVIGAGIAGLATATALQQRGHSVTVIEERTDTGSGAGISIWPNALAALDVLGLGDRVRAAGGRVSAGAIRWKDGSWLRRPSRERIVTALGEPLVVIQRAALRDVLAQRAGAGHRRPRRRRPGPDGHPAGGAGSVVGLLDPRGGRGRRRGRHPFGGGTPPQRPAGAPLRRIHRLARGRRDGGRRRAGRRDDGPGQRGRPCADGRRPDVLVRHRAGGRGRCWPRRANLPTCARSWRPGPSRFRRCWPPPTPTTSCATTSTTARPAGRWAAGPAGAGR